MRCIKTTRQSPWSEDPYIRGSYNKRAKVLVVHYSLGFIAYKVANGGIFFRCGTPKDAVYKDYKAKPLVRRSVHPRILQPLIKYFGYKEIHDGLWMIIIICMSKSPRKLEYRER